MKIFYLMNRYIGNYIHMCVYIIVWVNKKHLFNFIRQLKKDFKLLADTSSGRRPQFFWSNKPVRLNVKPHPDTQIKVCKLQVKNCGPTNQQSISVYKMKPENCVESWWSSILLLTPAYSMFLSINARRSTTAHACTRVTASTHAGVVVDR